MTVVEAVHVWDDPSRKPLSAALRGIAQDPETDRVSVALLTEKLRFRAAAALILIFSLPNSIPAPPGASTILGIPLVYLCLQMAFGRTPWLPRIISSKSMSRLQFLALVERIEPWLARMERYLRPRLQLVASGSGERVVGAFCSLLAIVVLIPIPMGQILPAAAISVMMMGLMGKDGLWIALGAILGLFSLLIVWGVLLLMTGVVAMALDQLV